MRRAGKVFGIARLGRGVLLVLLLAVTITLSSCTILERIGLFHGSESRAEAPDSSGGGPSGGAVSSDGSGSGRGGTAGRGGGRAPGMSGSGAGVAVAEIVGLNRTIQVAGRLRPATRITHELPIGGIIGDLAVSVGDRVAPGTVLLTIERTELGQTFRPVPMEARIAGVVSEILVQREEQARAGDPAVILVGEEGYTLEARVSDKDAADIEPGRRVVARNSRGDEIPGTLTVRSQEPDYESGMFTLTFRFPPGPATAIGTFLIVDVPTREVRGLFVPREAVDRRYGSYFLWVIDETEGVLRRREVRLGETLGEEVRVTDGIDPGERYLTTLSGGERDGAPAPGREG